MEEKRMRLGIIGTSGRGRGLIAEAIAPVKTIEIAALCDLVPEKMDKTLELLKEKEYPFTPWCTTDYHDLLDKSKIDAILIATCWNEHIELAIECMNAGIPCAFEVGGASSIDQCWDLVKTYERTKTPCFMMENCCFGRFELAVLNMIRQGLFGDVSHCEGGYQHFLGKGFVNGLEAEDYHQRSFHNLCRNGELYPTHEIGPISKYLDINRGNRFISLTSTASRASALNTLAGRSYGDGKPAFNCADYVTTLIRCANGETIMLAHDTMLPRPYCRGNVVHGTKGICMEINNSIYIEGVSPEDKWEDITPYLEKYEHPMWKQFQESGVTGGHGGMDGLEMEAFAYCVLNNVPFPIDVYDSAAWMAITVLSEDSIALGGQPVPFPDFTNGKWIHREPEVKHPYSI
ncbi:MAG: Gfo/Idh/MocA family oxidoreductase [Oscillospiraceae bacterium]|nr:Gfo/Idh/MocA family oxidoreductase [Oscillospiraceae bacterium]